MSIYFSTRNGGVRGAKALSEADEAWTSAVVAAACGYGDSRPVRQAGFVLGAAVGRYRRLWAHATVTKAAVVSSPVGRRGRIDRVIGGVKEVCTSRGQNA